MRISDVPGFLRGGLFYQSLDQEDEGAFEVPDNCIKNSAIVDSSEDLRLLMRTVQFWGLADIPLEVAEYILKNGEVADYKDLQPEFSELSKILQVKSAPFSEAISTAIKIELGVEVVRLMLRSAYPISAEACESAATVGDLESLMYLHTEGCPWDERITRAAACNDHLDCLQYALAQRCPACSDGRRVEVPVVHCAKWGQLHCTFAHAREYFYSRLLHCHHDLQRSQQEQLCYDVLF